MTAGYGSDGPVRACEAEALYDYEGNGPLPSWMTASGGFVYWTEDRTNELSRVSVDGGAREHIADEVGSGWATIAADEHDLFFAGSDGNIHRVSLDDTENVALAPSGERASALQRSEDYLYWHSSTGNAGSSSFTAQALRIKVNGGSAEVIWQNTPGTFSSGLAVADEYVFVDQFGWSGPGPLRSDGQVLRISSTTGDATPLATGLLVPRVHGANDRYVYFSAQNSDRHNELWRVSNSGGTPLLIQPGTFDNSVDVGQFLVKEDTVWWSEANRGSEGLHLYRADAASANVVPLVTMGAHHMLGLADEGQYLFFSSSYSFDAIGPAAIWKINRDCTTD